jgi:hypothetical protein
MPEDASDRPAGGPGEAPQPLRPSADSTRQESAGGAEAPQEALGDRGVVSRAEFSKVVGQRQAAKEKVRQLTAEVEELLARLHATPGEEELRAFQDWKRLQQEAGVPPAQQGQDLQAMAHRVRQPLKDRIEGLQRRKDALERRLMDLLRDQELRAAAARADAINPEQVVALLRDRVRMTETDDGRFVPEFADADGQPVFDGPQRVTDTDGFVNWFLSLPENANLVRSTVTPGSGAKPAGGLAVNLDSMPRTKAEFLSLPPDERLGVANRMTRQQRDAILGRDSSDGGGYL